MRIFARIPGCLFFFNNCVSLDICAQCHTQTKSCLHATSRLFTKGPNFQSAVYEWGALLANHVLQERGGVSAPRATFTAGELWVFAMCPALRGSTVSYAGDAHFPKHSLEYSLNFWSQSKKKTFTAGLPGMGWLLPLPKHPRKRANPWVQNLCKHPSVLPYPAPPQVKIHKMAPWEHPAP